MTNIKVSQKEEYALEPNSFISALTFYTSKRKGIS